MIGLGVLARIVSAYSGLRPLHPDEFHQTIEFTHFFHYGYMAYVHEVTGHLRNLTMPVLLALPYQIGDWWFPGSPLGRVFVLKLTFTLLNLSILWGSLRVLKQMGVTQAWRPWWLAFYAIAYFFVEEAGRTSIEHASAICLWLALGLVTYQRSWCWCLAGILLVGTGVMKYPAGLLGVGALCALIFHLRWRNGRLPLAIGIAAGLVLGGIADTVIYGRPYESLWMYLQYNVLTGTAEANFGANSAVEYLYYFTDRLGLLFFMALPFAVKGLWSARREPWVWAMLLYFLGHLVPAHKEPRFMAPIMHLFLLGAFYGAYRWRDRWREFFFKRQRWRGPVALLAALLLIVNTARTLETMRGELWKPRIDFFHLATMAEEVHACAIISVHRPLAFQRRGNSLASLRPIGVLPVGRNWNLHQGPKELDWNQIEPRCSDDDLVLMQLHQQDPLWSENGCQPTAVGGHLYAGLGQWVDKASRSKRGLYRCPASILSHFQKTDSSPLATRIPRLRSLPPYGIDRYEFAKYVDSRNFHP